MAERLAQKIAGRNAAQDGAPSGAHEPRVNPEVEAKIALFRKENPEYVKQLEGLSHDRLVNTAILRSIEKNENRQRVRSNVGKQLEVWLDAHPAIKQRIDEAVAKLPLAEQAGARFRMAESAVQREALNGVKQPTGQRI